MTDTTTEEILQTKPTPGLGRRSFFAAGGAAAAAVILAACGDDDDGDDEGGSPTTESGDGDDTSTTAGSGLTDEQIATFAAGLELLAANTYGAALEAAGSGALGEVPPAVAEYATVAQQQHQAASDALAEAAGGITPEVPTDIEATVNEGFAAVTDVAGLATFARDLEMQAAATYLDVIPMLQSEAAIMLTGSIYPIVRQRIAILNFALGEYPVPETFATAEGSLAPS